MYSRCMNDEEQRARDDAEAQQLRTSAQPLSHDHPGYLILAGAPMLAPG